MNSLSTFSLLKSWVEVLEIVSSLSSVSWSAAKDVPGSVPSVVSGSDHSSSACSASSSTFHSFLLVMMHLSLKFPSSSSITTSESESGSIHSMMVFFSGLMLTYLLGTITCFCSILTISCSGSWLISWTSPSIGWLNVFARSVGIPG